MRMIDLILKKREGKALTQAEIEWMIKAYINDEVPDYQMSAWAMAVYFNGMTDVETAFLTMAIVESGEQIDLSSINGVKVDKHSTGGVGDTTTLVLGPLVASCGVPVAKMSGRGLGHTGGTIDKLESFDGFNVELNQGEFTKLVNENKLAVIGQSERLTPADKRLYALRDVTATVDSIPLIASSIMSKKIASGADAIVLDVKTGSGAFMKKLEDSKALAQAMVAIGQKVNRRTVAIISNMHQPLGNAIGNALEVKEAIHTLQGRGPQDLEELCLLLGTHMLCSARADLTEEEAREQLFQNMHNGKALQTFKTFIASQGGRMEQIDDPSLLPTAAYTFDVAAPMEGYVHDINALEIGRLAMALGAGRITKDAPIDLGVGVYLHKKVGDAVHKGEPIATLHMKEEQSSHYEEHLLAAYKIESMPPNKQPLIFDVIRP